MQYERERALVVDFLDAIESGYRTPWSIQAIVQEYNYNRGRTDVIALTDEGELLAFEAKLTRWRNAMHQAYRNRCFAHRSYVLLPREVAEQAVHHASEFARRSIGVCTIINGSISVLIDACWEAPVQAVMEEKVREALRKAGAYE